VANKLKDGEGRLQLFRAFLDIANRRLSSVSVTPRLADDPLLLCSVLECGDVARTTDSA
jgi:hypothetical protein